MLSSKHTLDHETGRGFLILAYVWSLTYTGNKHTLGKSVRKYGLWMVHRKKLGLQGGELTVRLETVPQKSNKRAPRYTGSRTGHMVRRKKSAPGPALRCGPGCGIFAGTGKFGHDLRWFHIILNSSFSPIGQKN